MIPVDDTVPGRICIEGIAQITALESAVQAKDISSLQAENRWHIFRQ